MKLVINTGRPVAVVARELGVKEQTLGRWVNLFASRQQQQQQPPNLTMGDGWDDLCVVAADGLDVLASTDEAVGWVNAFVKRIAGANQCDK